MPCVSRIKTLNTFSGSRFGDKVTLRHATVAPFRSPQLNVFGVTNMKNLRTLLMALPIVAMSMPAAAHEFTVAGDWTVTLNTIRPKPLSGSSACFTLTQTGGVQHWMNSGTFTISGTSVAGQYYAVNSVLTGFADLPGNGFLLLTGHLFHHGIVNTSFLEITDGAPATGNFTAASGCG
jgi:hypothetical protein